MATAASDGKVRFRSVLTASFPDSEPDSSFSSPHFAELRTELPVLVQRSSVQVL